MKTLVFNDSIEVCEFQDLSNEAKKRAINSLINYWCNFRIYNSAKPGNFERAIDAAQKNNTPWIVGSFIYQFCYKEIIEELNKNNAVYDKNGVMIPIKHLVKEGRTVKSVINITPTLSTEVLLDSNSKQEDNLNWYRFNAFISFPKTMKIAGILKIIDNSFDNYNIFSVDSKEKEIVVTFEALIQEKSLDMAKEKFMSLLRKHNIGN